ncbi:hypothetical protein [Desulfovibrio inopinatus]|uniref:hypothetical protein n=1 Tax=Desulfovibrio inopinatus TaxID=102109 RepID=UPI00041CBF56|nr:hypothetical protein [Desulfovibrio inopinatus]
MKELDAMLATWEACDAKNAFCTIREELEKMDDVTLTVNARPGVSYSLRATHKNQNERPLFALVDIIDDDPEFRWLSVCFYQDMISDPDDRGDTVPGGLAGQDGYCFDHDDSEEMTGYLIQRIKEGYRAAQG